MNVKEVERIMSKWRYGVVANIVNERIDEEGITRKGTVVFPPGRKVYLSKRLWRSPDGVTVMGLNRFKSKYVLERVPLAHIENIRCQKVFKPRVIELMDDEYAYRDMWWANTDEDHLDTQMYVSALHTISSSSNELSDTEWLFVSDDCSTLSLYPYAGKAWEVGRQIRALNYDYNSLYMNGYCWSSLVRYYLRSKNSLHLLNDIEKYPEEHVCIFRTEKSNGEAIRLLSNTLRREVNLLPAWLTESHFDDWDDWG